MLCLSLEMMLADEVLSFRYLAQVQLFILYSWNPVDCYQLSFLVHIVAVDT